MRDGAGEPATSCHFFLIGRLKIGTVKIKHQNKYLHVFLRSPEKGFEFVQPLTVRSWFSFLEDGHLCFLFFGEGPGWTIVHFCGPEAGPTAYGMGSSACVVGCVWGKARPWP